MISQSATICSECGVILVAYCGEIIRRAPCKDSELIILLNPLGSWLEES